MDFVNGWSLNLDLEMFNVLMFILCCLTLTVCGRDPQDTVSLCTLRVCDVDM